MAPTMELRDHSPIDRLLRAPFVALGHVGRAAPALMPLLYALVTAWLLLARR